MEIMVNISEKVSPSMALAQGELWCTYLAWNEILEFAQMHWPSSNDKNTTRKIAGKVINAVRGHYGSNYYTRSNWFHAQRVHDIVILSVADKKNGGPFTLSQTLTLLSTGCALASHAEIEISESYYSTRILEELRIDSSFQKKT